MFSITWQSLVLGAAVGLICILGLSIGLKLLLENMPTEGVEGSGNKKKLFWGGVLLAGQFLAAVGILYFTRRTMTAPIGVALGILGSIFLGAIYIKIFGTKK